mmetsp:Transcript_41778/g.87688  ORF Transcript_41778/g.87688 Transcript_41778/m.87688 type:complete len:516 (-) Transcript_41778:72-1619(-)
MIKNSPPDPFLVEAFNNADVDGSGQLSKEELKLLLSQLGMKKDDRDQDQWFGIIDEDDNGEIGFDEFVNIFRRENEFSLNLEQFLRETFNLYDSDGSGEISREELKTMMAQLGYDLTIRQLDEMIAEVDENNNGEIDFQEFVTLFKGVEVGAKEKPASNINLLELGRCDTPKPLPFDDSMKYITFDPIFRFIMWLYAERRMVVLFGAHFVATVVIWAHFALIKFQQQADSVPEGAPRYWAKRIVPPLEFGSMHAILFQMALIPLTMSRYSIATLSKGKLNNYIPLNKALRIHIHLGYTMVSIVFFATIVFFVFFGILCSEGSQAFCDKFTSEIMLTGYFILGLLLMMAGTAYFRHSIPYEMFYTVHFLFIAMYSLAIAHTLDIDQRSGKKSRSQTFKWFAVPLVYYLCDYAMMYFVQRFETRATSYTAVEGRGACGTRMIMLKVKRPTLFAFQPGQYAFVRVNAIDHTWHPFSIASDPNASVIEFYIEVFEKGSWTERLWALLKNKDPRRCFSVE